MLRRAAPLVRTLRSTTTVSQSSTASSSGDNAVRNVARGRNRDEKKEGVDRRGNRRVFQPRFVDEHHQLMKKHGQSIDNSEMESLNDAIERIDWYSAVTTASLMRIAAMMKKSTIEELNVITDRSMATLFTAFGEMNKEMKREDKRKLLQNTVTNITEKGYSLGPLTRAAIFTAKVDMAFAVEDLPSVVDELSAWESAGVAVNEDVIVQAARVYAIQGDRKGVIELTNYARETFGRVEIRFLEWLSFSMIACGEGNGIAAIEKLSRSAPDSSTRLWMNGALAAAYKSDLTTVLECLSRVPHAAKIQNPNQNGPVVDIFVHLIERGVEGTEQSMGAYLALSEDGSSLYERHSGNAILASKTRRAVNEGKMDVATRLYSFVHESQRNFTIESELRKGLGDMGYKGEASVEEVMRCAVRLQEAGVIQEVNPFLLGGFRGTKLVEFVQLLRSNGQLSDVMSKCKVNKFTLASRLRNGPSSSPVSVIPTVAALLHTGRWNPDETIDDINKLIFKSANEDPAVIIRVMEELKESTMPDADILSGQIFAAAFSRILCEPDVLSSGRIEKLLTCPSSNTNRFYTLDFHSTRLLRNARDESVKRVVEFVADIFIAAYKNGGVRYHESKALTKIIGDTHISEEKIELLVNKLTQHASVGIGMSEMKQAQSELEQRGLIKRVELMGMLKKKSVALVRWMAYSPEELEAELNYHEKKEDRVDGLLCRIKTILMDKLADTSVPTDRLISILERIIPNLNEKVEEKGADKNSMESAYRKLRESTEKVYGKAMNQSVMEGDWSATEKLWRARGSIHHLPIAPCLAFSYHELRGGSKQLSEEIISTIRSNGQSVGVIDLAQLGDLVHDFTMEELEVVIDWLKKEMRLEEKDVARIKAARTRRGIEDMINCGRLEEAFNVMKETSVQAHNAIGHFDVLRAAIRYEKNAILESTVNLVASLHSKAVAILDLAYAFLLERKPNYGETLLKSPTLRLSPQKVQYFVKNAIEEKRIDVIHSLFSIVVSCPVSDEKVSNTDLNYMAITALRSYVGSGNQEAVKELMKEIEESTLVVELPLQLLIERVKKTARSSSV